MSAIDALDTAELEALLSWMDAVEVLVELLAAALTIEDLLRCQARARFLQAALVEVVEGETEVDG